MDLIDIFRLVYFLVGIIGGASAMLSGIIEEIAEMFPFSEEIPGCGLLIAVFCIGFAAAGLVFSAVNPEALLVGFLVSLVVGMFVAYVVFRFVISFFKYGSLDYYQVILDEQIPITMMRDTREGQIGRGRAMMPNSDSMMVSVKPTHDVNAGQRVIAHDWNGSFFLVEKHKRGD